MSYIIHLAVLIGRAFLEYIIYEVNSEVIEHISLPIKIATMKSENHHKYRSHHYERTRRALTYIYQAPVVQGPNDVKCDRTNL